MEDDGMRDSLATVGRVGLIILAWAVWLIGCAPLIAQMFHAGFSWHHAAGAAAAVLTAPGAAAHAVRVAGAGDACDLRDRATASRPGNAVKRASG